MPLEQQNLSIGAGELGWCTSVLVSKLRLVISGPKPGLETPKEFGRYSVKSGRWPWLDFAFCQT